jgi:DNA-directed RNA polymerase subunit RPC12/RpoP
MGRVEAIRYHYDVACPRCGTALARRGTLSVVCDGAGRPIDYWGIGGATTEELEAVYELTCRKCGYIIELDAPEHVEPYTTSEPDKESGPWVVKRR